MKEIPLDWAKIETMLAAGAPAYKIAEAFGVHRDTLSDQCKRKYEIDISTLSAQLRSKGDILIEVAQYNSALKGNIQMLLWLGKIRLKQKEPISEPSTIPNDEFIKLEQRILKLEYENAILRNDIKSKADPQLQ